MTERPEAGELEALVAIGEGIGEGIEKQQLSLPDIPLRQTYSPSTGPRNRRRRFPPDERTRPEALGMTAVTASERR